MGRIFGHRGNKDPHTLTLAELYDQVDKRPADQSKSIQKVAGGERKSRKGFDRTQFEPVWTQRFGGTPAQFNKIIALPRHRKRQASDGGDLEGTHGAKFLPTARSKQIASFLEKAQATRAANHRPGRHRESAADMGSREPTAGRNVHGGGKLGGLEIQLVYCRGETRGPANFGVPAGPPIRTNWLTR
jgi:hypothetical protein